MVTLHLEAPGEQVKMGLEYALNIHQRLLFRKDPEARVRGDLPRTCVCARLHAGLRDKPLKSRRTIGSRARLVGIGRDPE